MDKFIIFCLITFFPILSFTQDNIICNKVYKEDIKSVQMFSGDNQLSYPILELNGQTPLVLEFDDLNQKRKVYDFQYKIVQCNPDWTESSLSYFDYLDGFEENNITEYSSSFNTITDYEHYKIILPNENVKFKLSGNYAIIVYQNFDLYDTVLTMRFYVSEEKASVSGIVKRPDLAQYSLTHQQVNFDVSSSLFSPSNYQYVSVWVKQNGLEQNLKKYTPSSINGTTLIFNNTFENVLKAGNEYHYFDIQDLRRNTEKVAKIEMEDLYNVYLVPEVLYKNYFYYKDINGKYLINNYQGTEPESDADYVNVHFYLSAENPFPEDVYLIGDFNFQTPSEQYKMTYNKEHKVYMATLLLKQGYYNYRYFVKNIDDLDGNFFETKNDYLVLVYLYDVSMNYYRLISAKIITN